MSSVLYSKIGIVGESQAEIKVGQAQLGAMGFNDVYDIKSFKRAEKLLNHFSLRLLFVDDNWEGRPQGYSVSFVKHFSAKYPNCQFVLLTNTPSFEQFLQGVLAGVADYLCKSEYMDLGKEAMSLLSIKKSLPNKSLGPFQDLGLFRTLGLTRREIEILEVYMKGFPRHQELSDMVGKSTPQVRKIFSSIYNKLSVENPAQLAHLLTIALFLRST